MSESGNCILDHGTYASGELRYRRATIGLLCEMHRDRMDEWSAEVRNLLFDLMFVREAGSTPAEAATRKEKPRKSSAPPAPANLDWVVLLDARSGNTVRNPADYNRATSLDLPTDDTRFVDVNGPVAIPYLLEVPCQRLIDERPLSQPMPKGLATRLDMLRKHHNWIAAQDWVGEDYLELLRAALKALKSAVRDEPVKYRGLCHMCVGGKLWQDNGSSAIRCGKCKTSWVTPQQIHRLESAS